jgi:hypothetical protein
VAKNLVGSPVTALTLGRFVSDSSARAKARRLGLAGETKKAEERCVQAGELKSRRQTIRPVGREVPVRPPAARKLFAES